MNVQSENPHSHTQDSELISWKGHYTEPFEGEVLDNSFGNCVIKSRNSDGQYAAIKFKHKAIFRQSEAEMMAYANEQGILPPRVWECRPYGSDQIAMISDYVPGKPLDEVWPSLDESQRSSIKHQLRSQLDLFRKCTQQFIGRINRQPAFNPCQAIRREYIGPFDTEAEFDKWCLERVKGPFTRCRWEWTLSKLRKETSTKFVLTHGDLFPRNIMVDDGKIAGILDWENSGFFPEYFEYARAADIYDYYGEEWWKPVLMEVLEPCRQERLESQKLIYDKGY